MLWVALEGPYLILRLRGRMWYSSIELTQRSFITRMGNMQSKTDFSSKPRRRSQLNRLTAILVATCVMAMLLLAFQGAVSQPADITATPRPLHLLDEDARNMPIDTADKGVNIDSASSGSSGIGAFTVYGTFGYVSSGIWRNQWRHSMSWTRPNCDGCEITGYYFRLYKPSGLRYYSIRMGKRTSHNAYIANKYVAGFGTGTYRGVVKAVADNGEVRFSNSIYFKVTHIPATRTPTASATSTPTDTPTATATPISTPTPVPTPVYTSAPGPIGVIGGGIAADGTAALGWSKAARATSYDVRLLQNGSWVQLPTNSISVTSSSGTGELSSPSARITGLPKQTGYIFSVRAVNDVGKSRWVNWLMGTAKASDIPTSRSTNTDVTDINACALTGVESPSSSKQSSESECTFPKLDRTLERILCEYLAAVANNQPNYSKAIIPVDVEHNGNNAEVLGIFESQRHHRNCNILW